MTIRTLSAALALTAAAGIAHASVRVIHASPDAPNVDVYVNTTPGAGNADIQTLAFTAGTNYVPLPSADYRFRVTPTGAAGPVVIDATLPINSSQFVTVVATGFLSGIQPLVLNDDNTVTPGKAKIRFVHAAPDVPSVDIFAAGGTLPLFGNVSFRGNGGYLEVDPGVFNLEVRLNATGDLALPVPGVNLAANTVYTVFAMGSLAGGNVQAVLFNDSAAIPTPGALGLLAAAGIAAGRRRR